MMNIFINPDDSRSSTTSKVVLARKKAISWMMLDDELKNKWLTLKKKNQPVRINPSIVKAQRLSVIPGAERVNTAA